MRERIYAKCYAEWGEKGMKWVLRAHRGELPPDPRPIMLAHFWCLLRLPVEPASGYQSASDR